MRTTEDQVWTDEKPMIATTKALNAEVDMTGGYGETAELLDFHAALLRTS